MREMTTTDDGTAPMKFLTVPEVASLLRISKATAYRMCEREEIPAIKVGRLYRIPEAEFVARFRVPTSPAA